MGKGEYLFIRGFMIAMDVAVFAGAFAGLSRFGVDRLWALGLAVVFALNSPPTMREMTLDDSFRKRHG